MKNIIFLLVLFCTSILGQNWNNTVTTTVTEQFIEKMDLFTNSSGNHILIKRFNGSIVYYKLDSQGLLITSTNPTPFSTSGDFPKITGSLDRLYALYKEGNFIKGKYSTDGGVNWINLPNNIPTTSNLFNGLDAVCNDKGVHVVWATKDSYPYYETYYYRLNTNSPQLPWVDYKNVTDYTNGVGGTPSLAISENRIHVSYRIGDLAYPGFVTVRDRYRDDWLTPEQVINYPNYSISEKLAVRDNQLVMVWTRYYLIGYNQFADLEYRTRPLEGGNWSSSQTIDYEV